jgi:hypothetical protein
LFRARTEAKERERAASLRKASYAVWSKQGRLPFELGTRISTGAKPAAEPIDY